MADHEVARLDLLLLRGLVLALLHAVGTAGVELASGGGIGGGGNGALQHNPVHLRRGVRDGDGGEECLGVGVQGVLEDVHRVAVLHQVAQVHHAHRVGDVLHHAQVVGDEQVCELILLLQLLEQVDDLGLDGHVQGADGLVAHHELRVQGQGPGDADALALAAGELVGIALLVEALETAVVHDLVDIVVELLLAHQVVLPDGLADDLPHRQTGGQGGEGVLEDDLHLGAQSAHLLGAEIIDLLAVEEHLAAGLLPGQAQNGPAGGSLAAAGLAHQAHGGAPLEVEGDAVHGLDVAHGVADHAALDGEVLLQPVDHQDILGVIGDGGVVVAGLGGGGTSAQVLLHALRALLLLLLELLRGLPRGVAGGVAAGSLAEALIDSHYASPPFPFFS